jgi:hypothetical protein
MCCLSALCMCWALAGGVAALTCVLRGVLHCTPLHAVSFPVVRSPPLHKSTAPSPAPALLVRLSPVPPPASLLRPSFVNSRFPHLGCQQGKQRATGSVLLDSAKGRLILCRCVAAARPLHAATVWLPRSRLKMGAHADHTQAPGSTMLSLPQH